MEKKPLELIIAELDEIIRKYGYYYISEIELVKQSGNIEALTKYTRKIK